MTLPIRRIMDEMRWRSMTNYKDQIRPTDDPHAYPVCRPCFLAGYENSDLAESPKQAEVRPEKLPRCYVCGEPTICGLFLSDPPERCGICSHFIAHCVCAKHNLR